MKKILLFLGVVLFSLVITGSVDAKSDKKYAPESEEAIESGIYDVKGRPDLKLRVFVYHGKPLEKSAKPGPIQPTLICSSTPVNDPESEAVISNFGVTLPSTWEYRLNPSSVPSLVGAEDLPKIATNSFKVWQDEIISTTISRGYDTSVNRAQFDGQNIVSWGRASASALAVSYLWYYPDTRKMAEVDTIMNNRFAWEWSDPSTWVKGETCAYEGVYDAQNIMTHEFGHTMGLNDHYTSEYINNTMYGYGSKTETKKNTLTIGDISGVLNLYSQN